MAGTASSPAVPITSPIRLLRPHFSSPAGRFRLVGELQPTTHKPPPASPYTPSRLSLANIIDPAATLTQARNAILLTFNIGFSLFTHDYWKPNVLPTCRIFFFFFFFFFS